MAEKNKLHRLLIHLFSETSLIIRVGDSFWAYDLIEQKAIFRGDMSAKESAIYSLHRMCVSFKRAFHPGENTLFPFRVSPKRLAALLRFIFKLTLCGKSGKSIDIVQLSKWWTSNDDVRALQNHGMFNCLFPSFFILAGNYSKFHGSSRVLLCNATGIH